MKMLCSHIGLSVGIRLCRRPTSLGCNGRVIICTDVILLQHTTVLTVW